MLGQAPSSAASGRMGPSVKYWNCALLLQTRVSGEHYNVACRAGNGKVSSSKSAFQSGIVAVLVMSHTVCSLSGMTTKEWQSMGNGGGAPRGVRLAGSQGGRCHHACPRWALARSHQQVH
eukprot:3649813-Pyramimonas_sp.AAC.1